VKLTQCAHISRLAASTALARTCGASVPKTDDGQLFLVKLPVEGDAQAGYTISRTGRHCSELRSSGFHPESSISLGQKEPYPFALLDNRQPSFEYRYSGSIKSDPHVPATYSNVDTVTL
jgi:hypothetical protein